jgi:hypothetical protein
MTTSSTPRSGTAFFDALFAGSDGLLELRAFARDGTLCGRAWLNPSDQHALMHFVGAHLNDNIFFGVAPRRDDSGGALTNCSALGALFVDLDFKVTPEAEARRRIAECPLPPSAVIHSGGGLHVYYLLREPVTLQDPTDCATAYSLLRRLAHFLRADLQAAEPARILRVPGSSNFTYDPPRQARVETLDAECRYNVSEFDEVLPPEPVEAHRTSFVAPETILDGARNGTLFKEARSLKAKNFSRAALAAALHAENREKCDPPLPDEEVERIIASAWSQPDRAAFTQNGRAHSRRDEALTDGPTAAPDPSVTFQIVTPPESFITQYIQYAQLRTDAPRPRMRRWRSASCPRSLGRSSRCRSRPAFAAGAWCCG